MKRNSWEVQYRIFFFPGSYKLNAVSFKTSSITPMAVLIFFRETSECGSDLDGGVYGTELDALEADMGLETESDGMPSYLQDDKEPEMESDINLPAAPSGHAQPQVSIF